MNLTTLLVIAGVIIYAVCNATMFALIYWKRRLLDSNDPSSVLFHHFQVVPLPKTLTHNNWLHDVAMRKLYGADKLVGVQAVSAKAKSSTSERLARFFKRKSAPKDGDVACDAAAPHGKEDPCPLQEGDIILRIGHLFGPFTDMKIVDNALQENRRFQTQMLIYRTKGSDADASGDVEDPCSCSGCTKPVILDLSVLPCKTMKRVELGYMSAQTPWPLDWSNLNGPRGHRGHSASKDWGSLCSDDSDASLQLSSDSKEVCGICLDAVPNAVLSPCNHKICIDCHNLLIRKSCPYCREPIVQTKYELLI